MLGVEDIPYVAEESCELAVLVVAGEAGCTTRFDERACHWPNGQEHLALALRLISRV